MQLQAVIVPPPGVVEDALAAAHTISLAAPPPRDEPQPGLLQRLLRRPPGPAAPQPTVTVVPFDAPVLRVVRFGNVTVDDAEDLAAALGEAAASWSGPVVHVAGLFVERTDTELLVNARLGGETDGLRTLFGNVVEASRAPGFFLDRRSFMPELSVSSLGLSEGAAESDLLVDEAWSHQGPEWQATHLSIMRVSHTSGGSTLQEVASLALGPVD